MSSAAIERRVAPRFAVNGSGELAIAGAVALVRLSDMSMTGCGLEVVDGAGLLAGDLGRLGILNIRGTNPSRSPVMLPVRVCARRQDGPKARLGLQFRRLSVPQTRSLIGVLDEMMEK